MAYCAPRGIPLSRFLDWSQYDQDAALAWQAHEAARCPGCGTHPEEWQPEHGGHRRAYTVEAARCPGCEQVERVSEYASQQEGRGWRVSVRRNPKTD